MIAKSYKQYKRDTINAKKGLMPLLRPATKEDYINWLKSQKQVVRYTHTPWSIVKEQWYVATNHLLMPVELYGVDAINIIVPAHLYVEYNANVHMQWGHIGLYFEKTGGSSSGITDLYSDILNTKEEVVETKKKSWFRRSI